MSTWVGQTPCSYQDGLFPSYVEIKMYFHHTAASRLTCSSFLSATYPAAYSLVGQPFPHQPTLVAQQPQQPQQLQQREGKPKEAHVYSNGRIIRETFQWFCMFGNITAVQITFETRELFCKHCGWLNCAFFGQYNGVLLLISVFRRRQLNLSPKCNLFSQFPDLQPHTHTVRMLIYLKAITTKNKEVKNFDLTVNRFTADLAGQYSQSSRQILVWNQTQFKYLI